MEGSETLRRTLEAIRGIQSSTKLAADPGPEIRIVKPGSSHSRAPRVFISWAHAHSTWSMEQISDWESQLAEFAATLRSFGIDADIDLFHLDEPIDWTRFGPQSVLKASMTIVVMSEAWAERWSGTNSPREGAGAASEADALRGLFVRDQAQWQRQLVLVLFRDVSASVVPPDLQRVTRVALDSSDPDSYENLLRILTSQPRYPKPPLGQVPSLASRSSPSDHLSKLRSRLASTQSQRDKLLTSKIRDRYKEEAERLALTESTIRGFIEAALKQDD